MKCFFHNKRDAVAVCSSCGRGLCLKCTRQLKNSSKVYCEECVFDVNVLKDIIPVIRMR